MGLKCKKRKGIRWGFYGNTILPEMICSHCKKYSFIIKEKTVCCNEKIDILNIKKQKRYSITYKSRKKPCKWKQEKILEMQNYYCFYCENKLETYIYRIKKGGKKIKIFLKIEFDHYIPYSYSNQNKMENFVATCIVCNRIKNNQMFGTIEEAREFIIYRRMQKGYSL